MSTLILCMDCKTEIKAGEKKCPNCGTKNIEIQIFVNLQLLDNLKGKVKDEETPGKVQEFTARTKIAGKSGNLARENLSIDRTDKDHTIKAHKVEEFIDGKWVTVHEHTETYKAKRREKK